MLKFEQLSTLGSGKRSPLTHVRQILENPNSASERSQVVTVVPIQGGGFYFPRFGSAIFFQGLARPPPFRFLVTVIIFGLLDTKIVNCHRDRGGHGRHPRNCRRIWTLG